MIPQREILHVVFQVVHGAVPEGVIAQPDIIKILAAAGKIAVEPRPVQHIAAAIVQMQHDLHPRCGVPDGLNTRVQEQHDVFKIGRPAVRPQQPVGQLIPHRRDGGKQAAAYQRGHYGKCKIIDGSGQRLRLHSPPAFGNGLLAGVCPEIAVVEIQHPIDPGGF